MSESLGEAENKRNKRGEDDVAGWRRRARSARATQTSRTHVYPHIREGSRGAREVSSWPHFLERFEYMAPSIREFHSTYSRIIDERAPLRRASTSTRRRCPSAITEILEIPFRSLSELPATVTDGSPEVTRSVSRKPFKLMRWFSYSRKRTRRLRSEDSSGLTENGRRMGFRSPLTNYKLVDESVTAVLCVICVSQIWRRYEHWSSRRGCWAVPLVRHARCHSTRARSAVWLTPADTSVATPASSAVKPVRSACAVPILTTTTTGSRNLSGASSPPLRLRCPSSHLRTAGSTSHQRSTLSAAVPGRALKSPPGLICHRESLM